MPRMRILTASEQEAFDKPPRFDHRERKKFFEFPKALLDRAKTMHSRGHRIGFLVSCGYFRATRRFYAAADFEARDITYVANQLSERDAPAAVYPHRTRQRHQRRILEFYGFAPFDSDAESGSGRRDHHDGADTSSSRGWSSIAALIFSCSTECWSQGRGCCSN